MRRNLYRLLGLALGVIAGLFVAELGARLLLASPERVHVIADEDVANRRRAKEAVFEEIRREKDMWDPVLYLRTPAGVRLRANTRAVIENHGMTQQTVDIRTNSLGYRNRELDDKTLKRILFLGDSITMQDYLNEEDTIVRLVEEHAQSTDEPFETVNSGVTATGTANQLAILSETGLSTDPDAIVLNWYLNDLEPSPGLERSRPRGLLAYSRLALAISELIQGDGAWVHEDSSTIPPEAIERWREEVRQKFPPPVAGNSRASRAELHHWLQHFFLYEGALWADGAWEYMTPLLTEIKRLAHQAGIPLLIVIFPDANQVYFDTVVDDPQRKMKEVAADLEVPVLDLLPVLRQAASEDPAPLFVDWCHPSARGSRVIAQKIHDFVADQT